MRNHRDEFVREQDKALFDFDEDINDLENVKEQYQDVKINEKKMKKKKEEEQKKSKVPKAFQVK